MKTIHEIEERLKVEALFKSIDSLELEIPDENNDSTQEQETYWDNGLFGKNWNDNTLK